MSALLKQVLDILMAPVLLLRDGVVKVLGLLVSLLGKL